MQKYFKNPLTGKVLVFDVLSLKQLAMIKRSGFVEASIEERLKYIARNEKMTKKYYDGRTISAACRGDLNVHYIAPTRNVDGYGQSAVNIGSRIVKNGVYLDPIYRKQKIGLCYHLPNTLPAMKTRVQIAYTMFETNKYPDFWGKYLKKADLVLVPSEFCQEVMYDNFKIMPRLVPLGYNPHSFSYIHREKRDIFTFLHYDAFKWRKGWDTVFQAFNEEFGEVGGTDDVRLIFKTTMETTPPLREYPKIEVIKGKIPQAEFNDVMKRADCFVFPTRGEGFGLTPLEAIATGMPTIAPNHSGLTHYWNNRYFYPIDSVPIRAKYDHLQLKGLDLGIYLEPTVKSTRAAMRQAYNDWKAGTFYGRSQEMADYAKNFTIYKTAKILSEILKEFV